MLIFAVMAQHYPALRRLAVMRTLGSPMRSLQNCSWRLGPGTTSEEHILLHIYMCTMIGADVCGVTG